MTVKTWMVKHSDTELAALFADLAQLGDPALTQVAIERGEGLVVGLIAQAGHPVLMVEPAAFKASRPPWGTAGAKSDAADAFMLADYARTDGHRLRLVEPLAQATREPVRWGRCQYAGMAGAWPFEESTRGYLTIVGRAGVWPDSVQVLGGRLSSRLPTSVIGVALYRSALPSGAVAGAWLQRGLPSSQ